MSTIRSDELKHDRDDIFVLLTQVLPEIHQALRDAAHGITPDPALLKYIHYLSEQVAALELEGASYLEICEFITDNSKAPQAALLRGVLETLNEQDCVDTAKDTLPHDRFFRPQ